MRIHVGFFSVILAVICSPAYASNEIGTLGVKFVPVSSAGVTNGCSVVYVVSARDVVSNQGSLVILNGNISIHAFADKNAMLFSYNLGIRDMTSTGPSEPYKPHFMYLKSSKHSTAKSKFRLLDSDSPGYKTFVLQMDLNAQGILNDIVTEQKIQIGYNITEGGADLTVPVDLTVKDYNFVNGEVKRNHTREELLKFVNFPFQGLNHRL